MLTLFNPTQKFKIGEIAKISAIGTTDTTYTMTAYSTHLIKYLGLTGNFDSSTPVNFSITKDLQTFTSLNKYLYNFSFSSSTLSNPDLIIVSVINTLVPTETNDFLVTVGDNYANQPSLIHLYGYVYDAYGTPVSGEAIVLTVLNTGNMYFDNSATTSWTATAITDRMGRYDLYINRQYDYILSIHRLNYTKKIQVTTVPTTVTDVQVLIGPGSAC